MRAWLLLLAVLAAFKPIVQVASTEDHIPVINLIHNNNNNNHNNHKHNLNNQIDLMNYKNNINNNLNENNQHNNQNNIENLKNSDSEHKSTISNYNTKSKFSVNNKENRNNLDNNYKNNLDNNIMKPDPETLVEIESGLLTLFGLKKPPKIDRTKIIIPEAMKQLYADIMGHEYDSVTIPKPGLHTKTANTVRSFTHENSKIDNRFKKHHKFRLYFNINNIPMDEKLKAAELTINRDKIELTTNDDSHNININNESYRIFVYDILKIGIIGKRDPSYLLLDTKIIYLNSTEIISLDVQPAVHRWLNNPKKNYGLLIEVRTTKSLKPAKLNHVRLRRSLHESNDKWLTKQPLLFTYTDDGRNKPRSIRDTNTRTKRAHHRGNGNGNSNHHQRRKHGREQCQRRPLYVDFQDVGWSDWIVAPPGYEAYYCQGDCPFPLADHLNSTNHAVVQTLVNNITPAKVPKACCIPTQLTGISMLYLNDQHTVVLKNYQDMVVVGCGCR